MLPDEIRDAMMRRMIREFDEQLMAALRNDHRKRVAALRATRPAPGCIRSFGDRRGLVTAVTVSTIWMVDAQGHQFKVA
jgi:hypothetical protein